MSIQYLKVSFEKHKKISMLVKSLLFRLTWLQDFSCLLLDFERKFSNAWSLSSSFSLFSFFWYLYLSDCQSSGNWNFLLKLNLKFSVDRISSCWLGRSNFFYIFPSSCSAFLSIYLAYAFQINQLDIVLIFKQRKWQFYMD